MRDSVDEELLDQEIVKDLQTVFDTEESGAFVSLIADFVNIAEESLRSIETALFRRDWEEARQVAHRLKGMSSQLGALALRHQASILEQELERHPTPDLMDRLSTMLCVLERTANAYHELMGSVDQG